MIGKGLRVERHRELGQRLTELNGEFVDLQEELASAYPSARTLASRVRQLNRTLTDLRDALDDALWDEHPARAEQGIYHPGPWREVW